MPGLGQSRNPAGEQPARRTTDTVQFRYHITQNYTYIFWHAHDMDPLWHACAETTFMDLLIRLYHSPMGSWIHEMGRELSFQYTKHHPIHRARMHAHLCRIDNDSTCQLSYHTKALNAMRTKLWSTTKNVKNVLLPVVLSALHNILNIGFPRRYIVAPIQGVYGCIHPCNTCRCNVSTNAQMSCTVIHTNRWFWTSTEKNSKIVGRPQKSIQDHS